MDALRVEPIESAGGWQEQAACRHMDTEIFYPEAGDTEAINAAKAVCAGCPVVEDCYQAAIPPNKVETLGIWGGLTYRERLTRRRRERGIPIEVDREKHNERRRKLYFRKMLSSP